MNGLHQEQSFENLKPLFGKNASSRTKVFFWFGEFRRGRRSFDDAHRCGTPETAGTVTNIEAAEAARVSTQEIQESLSIGTEAPMSVLHDHLRVRKRCARWIRH